MKEVTSAEGIVKLEIPPEVVKFFERFGVKYTLNSGRVYLTPPIIGITRDPYECTWRVVNLGDLIACEERRIRITEYDKNYEESNI
jgi:hypothetical protein